MPHPTTATFISALAFSAGGALLVIKAAWILLTGNQPAVLYEIGQLLFTVGLLAFYRLAQPLGRGVLIAYVLAVAALVSGLALVFGEAFGVVAVSGSEFVLPWSIFFLSLGPGAILALIILGLASLRSGRRPVASRAAVYVGLLAPLLLATAPLHIELPILLMGCSWIFLGLSMSLSPLPSDTART